MIRTSPLHAAEVQGQVLMLDEPLSLWGGFDPTTGKIIDVHHPQCGEVLTGRIVLMRESKGSGTASGALAEAIRRGTAPAAIILGEADVNLAIGAEVAATLYGRNCAVLTVDPKILPEILRLRTISIAQDGSISPA